MRKDTLAASKTKTNTYYVVFLLIQMFGKIDTMYHSVDGPDHAKRDTNTES